MDNEKLVNLNIYDLIHLLRLERTEIPPKLLFEEDYDTYVLPNDTHNNPKIPSELAELFADTNDDILEYDGWVWKRQKIPESSVYFRERYASSDLIMIHLNPYLGALEGLEGKTVKPSEILPPFESFKPSESFKTGSYFVPETPFLIGFYQNDRQIEMPKVAEMQIYAMLGFGKETESGRHIFVSPHTTVMRVTYEGIKNSQIV